MKDKHLIRLLSNSMQEEMSTDEVISSILKLTWFLDMGLIETAYVYNWLSPTYRKLL